MQISKNVEIEGETKTFDCEYLLSVNWAIYQFYDKDL